MWVWLWGLQWLYGHQPLVKNVSLLEIFWIVNANNAVLACKDQLGKAEGSHAAWESCMIEAGFVPSH